MCKFPGPPGMSGVRHQSAMTATEEEELDNLPFSEMVLQLADKVSYPVISTRLTSPLRVAGQTSGEGAASGRGQE